MKKAFHFKCGCLDWISSHRFFQLLFLCQTKQFCMTCYFLFMKMHNDTVAKSHLSFCLYLINYKQISLTSQNIFLPVFSLVMFLFFFFFCKQIWQFIFIYLCASGDFIMFGCFIKYCLRVCLFLVGLGVSFPFFFKAGAFCFFTGEVFVLFEKNILWQS